MSASQVLLYVILPYFAVGVFVVGHYWRYKTDQFGWTSHSTQILESNILGWAGPAFHYGALAAIGGHVLGILIPDSFTRAVGISEHTYHWISAILGTIAGLAVLVGLAGLVYRRATNDRVRRTTSRVDILAYALIAAVIVLGCMETIGDNLLGASHDYRETVAPWFRSLFYLDPEVQTIAGAPLLYELHAIAAWGVWIVWPFSRLVHAWSIPLQYLGRPYILYRRRYPRARTGRPTDVTSTKST